MSKRARVITDGIPASCPSSTSPSVFFTIAGARVHRIRRFSWGRSQCKHLGPDHDGGSLIHPEEGW
jgi:hypothetical protein